MQLHETQQFPTTVGGATLTFYDDGRQTGTPHVNGRTLLIPVRTCGGFALLRNGKRCLVLCHVWLFEEAELEELYRIVGNLEDLGFDEGDLPSSRVFFGGSTTREFHGVAIASPFVAELPWACWDVYQREGEEALYTSGLMSSCPYTP